MIKWLKSLFCHKTSADKRVLEKISIVRPITKKRNPACKKSTKKAK